MNTAPGIPNRKRKKSDTNSDLVNAQVKCLNEKRRRELENAYISELANLISASDMAQNGKKDKCVILQETVNQIKNIKGQQEGVQDAVQQGEVSSSRPAISAHDFGPLLLEALEAFVFIVNSECQIEYITEHVTEFLKYRREELQGKSIFNYIHHGDHGNFSNILRPMIRSTYALQGDQSQKSRGLVCRMLVKNQYEATETMEEKQKRVSEYENMQLSILKKIKSPESAGVDPSHDGSDGHLLVCIARKTADTKAAAGGGSGAPPAETFITRLDPSGRIVAVETQNLTPSHVQHFTKELVGQSLLGLVWVGDQAKLMAHIEKVVTGLDPGPHTLDDLRLRGTIPGKYFRVQTRTKRFKSSDHVVFINAMHTILCEEVGLEPAASPRSGLLSPPGPMAGPRPATRPLSGGGGVSGLSPASYTAVAGFSSAVSSLPSSLSNTITLNTSAGFSTLTVPSDVYNGSDILSELFSSSSPLDTFGGGGVFAGGSAAGSAGGAAPVVSTVPQSRPPPPPPAGGHMYVNTSMAAAGVSGSRPSSRQSHNSTPTPHTGSLPSFSPAGQQQPSPLPYQPGFQFSPPSVPEYGRQTPAGDAGEEGQMKSLLAPRSVSSDQLDAKDSIMQSSLLGPDDDSTQKLLLHGGAGAGNKSTAGGDILLRQMLNDRGDQRNEQRAKAKKNEEVLMLLLKSGAQHQQQQSPQHPQPSPQQQHQQPSPLQQQHQQQQQQQDMMNSLRRPSGGASPRVSEPFDISAGDLLRGSKRTSQDGDGDPLRVAKKQVRYPSGGGMMELAPPGGPHDSSAQGLPARNRMLAKLLSSNTSPSPTVPTTIAQQARPTDLPQDKLPRPDELRSKLKDQGGRSRPVSGVPAGQEGAPDPLLLLGPARTQQPQQQQQQQNINSGTQHLGRPLSAPISQGGPPPFFSSMSAGDVSNELDNILDDIINIESQTNGGHGGSFNISEKQAIHEIQQRLMSVEAIRPPMTPTFSSAQNVAQSSGAGFPPPYPQSRPRLGGLTSHINMVRSHMSQFPVSNQSRMTSHQMVERQRLLQQQQHQRLLVNQRQPASDASGATYQNIDNILNSTAPNVSLQQRLVGGGQESQASPNYSSAVGMSPLGQMSPGQPCPSPHSPSLAGGQPAFPGGGYTGGGGQVSPRAAGPPPTPQGSVPSPFQAQLSPGGPPQQPPMAAQARAAAAAAAAAGKLQQQNPELNAQLSGTFGVRGQSYQLPQRNAPLPRQPQFPASQQQQQQLFQQQQQQLRLQRQASVPPAGPAAMTGGSATATAGVAGAASSDFVRQELRRSIINQQRQPPGRSLTQGELEEFGLEVAGQGHDGRWSVQQPAPPAAPPDDTASGGAGGGGHPTSLLRDLLMSD